MHPTSKEGLIISRISRRDLAENADQLLTRERLTVYPCLLLLAWLATFTASLVVGQAELLPDFAARWTAGHLVVSGDVGSLYDPGVQSKVQAKALRRTSLSWFVSPPFVAVLFAPLGALPYGLACILWSAVSVGALVWAMFLLKPLAPVHLRNNWHLALLIGAACAPTLELLGSGQDTSLIVLAVVAGMRMLRSGQPGLAGAVLALGLVKPHLIFLVPVLLLLRRQWHALAGFASTGAALLGLGWALVGSKGMATWLSVPFTPLYVSEVTQGQAWKSTSLSALLIGVAPSADPWWNTMATLAGMGAVIAGLAVLVKFRGRTVSTRDWGILLLTTCVASPHVMLYDVVLAVPAVLVTPARDWDASLRVRLAATFALLWLMSPLHAVALGLPSPAGALDAPWAALGLLLLWVRSLRVGPSEERATRWPSRDLAAGA